MSGGVATTQLARETFAIAYDWRGSHACPMRSMRHSVIAHTRRLGISNSISAARLKRMKAIRAKLCRISRLKLHTLQDLGGCRFILPTIADVHALTAALRDDETHILRSEQDFIANPKPDGYPGRHLMYTYVGMGGQEALDRAL